MKKMYILTNDKLSKSQSAVQAAHAVAEYMYKYGWTDNTIDWVENHKTMVILKATESEIHGMITKLARDGKCFSKFYESDLDDLLTAVVFEPMREEVGNELFFNFKLL